MHYIAWLIAGGAVPYRDAFDMNLPRVYLIHWAVLSIAGAGDLGWRLFEDEDGLAEPHHHLHVVLHEQHRLPAVAFPRSRSARTAGPPALRPLSLQTVTTHPPDRP